MFFEGDAILELADSNTDETTNSLSSEAFKDATTFDLPTFVIGGSIYCGNPCKHDLTV